jgi:hypothetical protein
MTNIITDIEQLKAIAGVPDSNGFDGFISLAGGAARSSKQIWYDAEDDTWALVNWIDESEEQYNSTAEFLANEPNIVYAMANNALVSY